LTFFKWKIKFTFFRAVIIAMILGVGCGIVFGERCSVLAPVGKAYIALLQMCVLPYVIISIISGIGRLGIKESKALAFRGIFLSLIFWGIMALYIVLSPLCFPSWKVIMFFSPNTLETTTGIDYLKLYIPSNPFYSLANNLVPGITVFCICAGVALISVKNKKIILENLDIWGIILRKINNWVVMLTPIGTFALLANLSGTITVNEIVRMQVYLVTCVSIAILLTFCIFPLLITTFTDFKYMDIMRVSKNALLTAFATGNVFVLLPIISNDVKQLIKNKNLDSEERRIALDTTVSICFNIPLGGRVLLLIFIPFAAWFYGVNLSIWEYPKLICTGILCLFGNSISAMLFLLNHFHIPTDIIDFFAAFKVLNNRIGALLSSIYLLTLAILCTAWLTGFLKINIRKIVKNFCIIVVASLLTLVACSSYLKIVMNKKSSGKEVLAKMQIKNTVRMKIFKKYPTSSQVPTVHPKHLVDRLQLIKTRGVLRVGYSPTSRPFSYFNSANELVGYDMAMANMLAKDLGCRLELIPVKYNNIDRGLFDGVIDIVMAGVSVTLKRIKTMHFTDSYMQVSLAFVVKDYEREQYQLTDNIRKMSNFRVACVPGLSYRVNMKKFYPNLTFVDIESEKDFFDDKVKADALLVSAEEGFAWCVLHPAFCVVVPRPKIFKENLAYVTSQDDLHFCKYLNSWIGVKKTNGTLDALYQYWIMGKNIHKKEERWCIWNDVWK
jgi:Na+/H+-dicarboxylate symporter/ABC-type amino acid transport substrate-binding protein